MATREVYGIDEYVGGQKDKVRLLIENNIDIYYTNNREFVEQKLKELSKRYLYSRFFIKSFSIQLIPDRKPE